MRKLLPGLVVVFLTACAPAECTPDAPLGLGAISGLQLIPDTTGVILRSDAARRIEGPDLSSSYSCPTFDFTGLTAQLGELPLSTVSVGGPDWKPPSVYSPYGGGGTGNGVCTCIDAFLRVEGVATGGTADQAVSNRQYEVTLSQGSTVVRARYLDVSNSVRVVEVHDVVLPPNERWFRLVSGFDRIYTVARPLSRERGPWATSVKVVARNQGAAVTASVDPYATTLVKVSLAGPADELTFETTGIYQEIQAIGCEGAASCEPLVVIAPNQTVKL